ncbi:unspecified product [Leishmania tarentolae]|uniref:Unspecified product n=1 Tax=Leishmania tarentolae TaxID=5689 RepID=A0A640KL18_LEITA|nr:unspecified product [Leishmania tarentolae]GET90182.1 unspecified product [Leishmania tarentolae]
MLHRVDSMPQSTCSSTTRQPATGHSVPPLSPWCQAAAHKTYSNALLRWSEQGPWPHSPRTLRVTGRLTAAQHRVGSHRAHLQGRTRLPNTSGPCEGRVWSALAPHCRIAWTKACARSQVCPTLRHPGARHRHQ